MKKQRDWREREYSGSCLIREECRNNKCRWQTVREGPDCLEELETCPDCGTTTNVTLWFGGLLVRYNRVMDNFTFLQPHDRFIKNHVDNADCPDTILFMLKHFKFDGWPEAEDKKHTMVK